MTHVYMVLFSGHKQNKIAHHKTILWVQISMHNVTCLLAVDLVPLRQNSQNMTVAVMLV